MNNFIVYCAKFPNGKIYIGLTGKTLKQRKAEHYKPNKKYAIHNALKVYKGQEVWEVLASGLTRDQAVQKEIELIKTLNTKSPNGYDLTDGGDGTSGKFKLPEATKIQMYKPTPFEVYKLDGTFVGEYLFQTACAKELNLRQPKIWQCLTGKCSQTQGYKFKYKNQDFQFIPKQKSGGRPKGFIHSLETRAKMSEAAMGNKNGCKKSKNKEG